jgi:hypothetical protein
VAHHRSLFSTALGKTTELEATLLVDEWRFSKSTRAVPSKGRLRIASASNAGLKPG